jgi:hypothetical protein
MGWPGTWNDVTSAIVTTLVLGAVSCFAAGLAVGLGVAWWVAG